MGSDYAEVKCLAWNKSGIGASKNGIPMSPPATPEFWQTALRDAGFVAVGFQPVVAEAGLVMAGRPSAELSCRS